MTRSVERTSELTRQHLRSIRKRLESISASVQAAEDMLAQSGQGATIWSFRVPSLETGLDKIESFAVELDRSLAASIAGEPYHEDTTKQRAAPGSAGRGRSAGINRIKKRRTSRRKR